MVSRGLKWNIEEDADLRMDMAMPGNLAGMDQFKYVSLEAGPS